jgi:hypothetical protein
MQDFPEFNHESEKLSYGTDTVPAMPSVPINVTTSDSGGHPPDIPAAVTEQAVNPVLQQSVGNSVHFEHFSRRFTS